MQPPENSNRLFPARKGDETPPCGIPFGSPARVWCEFLAAWRSERTGPISGSLWNTIFLILLLAPAYFGVGQIAFSMEVGDFNITSQVFFPEGVALIFVILFGPRVAPGIVLGQFILAHVAGLPVLASAMTAVIDTGAVILSGYFFWRWRISPRLDRPREMALLVMLCALVLQPISTTGGTLAHYLFHDLPADLILSSWANWWMANVLGQVLLVPLVLSWLSRPKKAQDRAEIRHALLISSFYFIPLAFFASRDWGEIEPVYRLLLFAGFHLPLIGIAVRSHIHTVSFIALLLASPVILLVHVGPGLSAVFAEPVRYFCANLIMCIGVVASLLLSSLREELMLRNGQLHDAVAARERLFAVIGHDLRGPIGMLRTYLDLMISGDLSKEDFQVVQHHLRMGVNQAHEALEGLMEWGASFETNFRHVSLHKCVTEAIELLTLTANRKQIEIENNIPQLAWLEADGYQVESIFRNLLSNAVKFTGAGGHITLSASKKKGFWNIAISDTGVGMTPERANRLLRPSNEYRSTPGTADERGLGLGLQICHEFVRTNRGAITVTSETQVGTTFYVSLPAIDAPEQ